MSEPPPPTEGQDESTISFDIFNYPPPLQEQILRKMHPKELFQFWLTGKKARDLIQKIKMEKNEQEIHIDFHIPYKISIEIKQDDRSLHFVADRNGERDLEDGECVGQFNIDGCNWFLIPNIGKTSRYRSSRINNYAAFVADNKKFDVVRTVTMLKTIFNTELVFMKFKLDESSMGCSFQLCGKLGFTESLARILKGRFSSTGRVSREKKIDLLVALLRSPQTEEINIDYRERHKKIHIERHLNFVLKLWNQHAVPGRMTHLTIDGFHYATRPAMENVSKNMNRITDIKTVVFHETIPLLRTTADRAQLFRYAVMKHLLEADIERPALRVRYNRTSAGGQQWKFDIVSTFPGIKNDAFERWIWSFPGCQREDSVGNVEEFNLDGPDGCESHPTRKLYMNT